MPLQTLLNLLQPEDSVVKYPTWSPGGRGRGRGRSQQHSQQHSQQYSQQHS